MASDHTSQTSTPTNTMDISHGTLADRSRVWGLLSVKNTPDAFSGHFRYLSMDRKHTKLVTFVLPIFLGAPAAPFWKAKQVKRFSAVGSKRFLFFLSVVAVWDMSRYVREHFTREGRCRDLAFVKSKLIFRSKYYVDQRYPGINTIEFCKMHPSIRHGLKLC